MSLYVLIVKSARGSQSLTSLPQHYPDHRPLTEAAWLISTNQTTKEISETLFPRSETDAEMPNHVIFRVDAWWGWNDQDLWEWITARAKRGEGKGA